MPPIFSGCKVSAGVEGVAGEEGVAGGEGVAGEEESRLVAGPGPVAAIFYSFSGGKIADFRQQVYKPTRQKSLCFFTP